MAHAQDAVPALTNNCMPADELIKGAQRLLEQSDDPFEDYAIVRCALELLKRIQNDSTRYIPPLWIRICVKIGAFQDAIQIADSCIGILENSRNQGDLLEALRCKAKAERNLGNFVGAEHTYRRSVRIASLIQNAVDLSIGLLLIGKLNGNYRGQHSLFAAFVQEACSRLQVECRKVTGKDRARIIYYLSVCYDSLGQAFRTNNPARASREFSHAIRLSTLLDNKVVGLRSRCHLIREKFLAATNASSRIRFLHQFEYEIKNMQSLPDEEPGLAVRWLQYATMLHQVGIPERAREYIIEAQHLAQRYNAYKIYARAALAEYDLFASQDFNGAISSLVKARNVAVRHCLALQEIEINLRLANLRKTVPLDCPHPLELMERNRQLDTELIEYARQGLTNIEKPGDDHPEFGLLSPKTRDLFRENLLIDYQQAVTRFSENLEGMKSLLLKTERRRQEAVALGISNSLARALLHQVKLNLDEKTGRSPVFNTASDLRKTVELLARSNIDGNITDINRISDRLLEYAHRLEYFDDKLSGLKELLIGRLRRIRSLDERVSVRLAAITAINELKTHRAELTFLETVNCKSDIEVMFERELMTTVIGTLLDNAIQAYDRHNLNHARIELRLFARVHEKPDVGLRIASPVMQIVTSNLTAVQSDDVYYEIAAGLKGEAVSSPSSTGFGLELADTVFVQLMAGTLAPFKLETEAGLEVVFNTNDRRAKIVKIGEESKN